MTFEDYSVSSHLRVRNCATRSLLQQFKLLFAKPFDFIAQSSALSNSRRESASFT